MGGGVGLGVLLAVREGGGGGGVDDYTMIYMSIYFNKCEDRFPLSTHNGGLVSISINLSFAWPKRFNIFGGTRHLFVYLVLFPLSKCFHV